jgi:cobalt/nickel transport system permease protein
MLIEQAAYASSWRHVSPAAKGLLALGGLAAAFAATTAAGSLAVAAMLLVIACLMAGVPVGVYLRVAAPALFFLALGSISLVLSLGKDPMSGALTLAVAPDAMPQFARVSSRSLGALAALLLLVLTTPLPDLISLLRRLKTPELLLDLMVLCYRMLFVFSTAVQDTLTAQSARLGYATPRLALRSLGGLSATLAVQVWQRAQALHIAAQARNNDGPLRFLAPAYINARRDSALALAASGVMIMLGRLL